MIQFSDYLVSLNFTTSIGNSVHSIKNLWCHNWLKKMSDFFLFSFSVNSSLFFVLSLSVVSTKVKLSPFSRGRPEGSLFNSYYTEMLGRALLLSLDCSTLPLICALYCWVLSKEVSSTIFKVFGMMRPGIKHRSPRPLANTLPTVQ